MATAGAVEGSAAAVGAEVVMAVCLVGAATTAAIAVAVLVGAATGSVAAWRAPGAAWRG